MWIGKCPRDNKCWEEFLSESKKNTNRIAAVT
jgi:hypothetical protein